MNKATLPLVLLYFIIFNCVFLRAQLVVDTLAFQDFDTTSIAPTWNYSGTPNAFSNGFTTAAATPANSPIGLGGSWAWNLTSVSGGNPVIFNNTIIPPGYDSVRFHFSLAAMNLGGTTGGPDNLDYVLVEYSIDNGTIFTSRLRIRGAVANNSSWAYDATGIAKVFYTPLTETVFQPTTSGLQVAEGYSNCEIVFPGSVSQVMIRITPRSSSASDTWLLDNIMLTGEKSCVNSTSTLNVSACDSYLAPSGAVLTSTGIYNDTINNSSGCDSVITINLTMNYSTSSNINPISCTNYLSPAGNTYSTSGLYIDTIGNALGCDSVITINLTINSVDVSVNQSGDTLVAQSSTGSFQWIDCNTLLPVTIATSSIFIPTTNGNYAVVVTDNGCTDTSNCFTVSGLSLGDNQVGIMNIFPNPTTDHVTIVFNSQQMKIKVEVLDEMGRMIICQQLNQSSQMDVDLSELTSGIYIIRVTNNEGQSYRRKVIKQ